MLENILKILLYVFGAFVFFRIFHDIIHHIAAYIKKDDVVNITVLLPRNDDASDRQKDTEKDFKETIGIMSQLFRSLHEIRELDFANQIKVWLFKLDIVSFDIVCKESIIEFRVRCLKDYADLVEKQITTYYPDASIEFFKADKIVKPGFYTRFYYSYLVNVNWYAIKLYKEIENDPLNTLTNVFSKLSEEEYALISLTIRPRNSKWQIKANEFGTSLFKGKSPQTSALKKIPGLGFLGDVFGAIFFGYEKSDLSKSNAPGSSGGDSYVRMLQANEETAKKVGEKSTQLGYDTVIRIGATSKTKRRTVEILNSIFVAFNVFKDASSNWFEMRRIIPIDWINNKIMVRNLSSRYFSWGEKTSLLVPDELANIIHFPNAKYNATPAIKWLKYKVLPAPVDMPDKGLFLGYNVYRGEKTPVFMLTEDRTKHFYMIGKSGAGKSNFISFMARQDAWNDKGFCVVDPHGDLVDEVLDYIPKSRAKDVIYFNPSDLNRPMALNMLEAKDAEDMDMISSQATEIFIKLFGDEIFGPRIQHYFRNACLTLMEDPEEGATLIDVPRIFTDDQFMEYKVKKAKNPVVKSFWQNEYAKTGKREREEMIPFFLSKFGPFITNTIMRNTIGQHKSAFNFRDVMDQGKILLINLSKGKIGDLNTQLLGLIMVSKIQMAAMSRADMDKKDRRDFYLYVDEFQNFATDSFATILSEARKYRLNLIMAHQFINQLVKTKYGKTSSEVRDAVFGNVGTLMSFKVGAEDAEYLVKEYRPVLNEQDIINVANYKAYMKLNINNTTSRPFSLELVYSKKFQNQKVAKLIKKYSSLKYARERKFVEQEVSQRIGFDYDDKVNFKPPSVKQSPGAPRTMDSM